MSNNRYQLFMDVNTSKAKASLAEVERMMDKIEAKSAKGGANFSHASQKDIDEAIADMQRYIEARKEVEKESGKQIAKFSVEGDTQSIDHIRAGLEQLQSEAKRTQDAFAKMTNMNSSPNNINRTYIKDQKLFQSELSNTEKALQKLTHEYREVQRTASRVGRVTRSSTATGRMTHMQAERLRSDFDKRSTFEDRRKSNEQDRSRLVEQIQKDAERQAQVRQKAGMETDPAKKQAYKAEESALYESIQANRKLVEQIKKVNDGYDRLISSMKTDQSSMQDSTVRVDADRNTALGQMQSRAPSIALASIGSAVGVFGSAYARGATASKAMREPSINIGQQTGQTDYRALRREAQKMGIEHSMGYKGGDMLQFQEDALGSMGYTNKKALNSTTRALAEGTRAVPVDKETLSSFMTDNMRNGSVKDGSQVKAIQEGFLGAIEQSGMAGREKEQIEALKGLSAQVFTGRQGSNDELKGLMAMQSMLSGTGNKSVQGEAGGKVLSDLSAGITGGINDSQTRMMFGMGTKYKGLGGIYDLAKQLEGGANAENMRTIMGQASKLGGGDEKKTKSALMLYAKERLGTDLTTDQVDGIMKAYGNGKLSDKEFQKVLDKQGVSGKKKYDKNGKAYEDSSDATRNSSEAVNEKQDTDTYDNALTDNLAKVNEKMGQLPSIVGLSIKALVAFTAALTMSSAMSFGSSLLKDKASSVFSTAGNTAKTAGAGVGSSVGGSSLFSEIGNAFKSGKANGGIKEGIKSAFSTSKDVGGLGLSSIKDAYKAGGGGWSGVKGAFNESKGVGSAMFKSADNVADGAKGLSKMGSFFSKANVLLTAGMSAIDIATSDDKGKAVGRNAGSISGSWAGTKAGFALGAKSGNPWVTALASIAGGIGGATFGSKIGEGVVDAKRGISNKLFGEKATKENEAKQARFDKDIQKNNEQLFGWVKPLGKKALGGVKRFFGGEEVEASEIDDSVGSEGAKKAIKEKSKGRRTQASNENRAKDKESKDNVNKHATAEKTREANNAIEKANLSLYAKLLDRAMQVLNRARAQNGIFGNSGGVGSGDDSSDSGSGSGSDSGDTSSKSKDYNGDWEKAIRDAAKESGITDLTDADVNKLLSLIQHESNGDETVVNTWDSNAQKGTPSKGLIQFIDPTFDQYKAKGYGDINKGYDQLMAYFNNANWRQDTTFGGWGPTGSTRHAMGGKVTSPEHALLGEVAGQEEYVINPHQPTAPRLLAEATAKTAQKFRLYGNGSGNDWSSQAVAGSSLSTGGSSQAVTLQNTNDISVTVNVSGDTPQSIAQQAGEQVASKFDRMASDAMDFFSKEYKRS